MSESLGVEQLAGFSTSGLFSTQFLSDALGDSLSENSKQSLPPLGTTPPTDVLAALGYTTATAVQRDAGTAHKIQTDDGCVGAILTTDRNPDTGASGEDVPTNFLHRMLQSLSVEWGVLATPDEWRLYTSQSHRTDQYLSISTGSETPVNETAFRALYKLGAFSSRLPSLWEAFIAHREETREILSENIRDALPRFAAALISESEVDDSDAIPTRAREHCIRGIILGALPAPNATRLGAQIQSIRTIASQINVSGFTLRPLSRAVRGATEVCRGDDFAYPGRLLCRTVPDSPQYESGLRELLSDSRPDLEALSITDIGRIYESLVDVSVSWGEGGYSVGGTGNRMDTGVFYTPPQVAGHLTTQTLSRAAQLPPAHSPPSAVPNPSTLTDLAVLDPALGGGQFLFHACERLATLYATGNQSPMSLPRARREVLDNCLYAVDIDREAVAVATACLWGLTIDDRDAGSSLPTTLFGDSIFGFDFQNLERVAATLGSANTDYQSLTAFTTISDGVEEIQTALTRFFEADHDSAERTRLQRQLRTVADVLCVAQATPEKIPAGGIHHLGDALNTEKWESVANTEWVSEATNTIAGTGAVHWQLAFPNVFEDGGFDAVIGNPPYYRLGRRSRPSVVDSFYRNAYRSGGGNLDVYVLFTERAYQLLNRSGELGVIQPQTFFRADFATPTRHYFEQKQAVDAIVSFGHELVFDSASVYTCLLYASKQSTPGIQYGQTAPTEVTPSESLPLEYLELRSADGVWWLGSPRLVNIFHSLREESSAQLSDMADSFVGIQTGLNPVFILEGESTGDGSVVVTDNMDGVNRELSKDVLEPLVRPDDVSAYTSPTPSRWLLYPYRNGSLLPWRIISSAYDGAAEHLRAHETELRNRDDGGMDNDEWYGLSRAQNLNRYTEPKLLTTEIGRGASFAFDRIGEFHPSTVYGVQLTDDSSEAYPALLSVLNSPVLWGFFNLTSEFIRGGYAKFKTNYLSPTPVPAVITNLVQSTLHDPSLTQEQIARAKSEYLDYHERGEKSPRWVRASWIADSNELIAAVIERALSDRQAASPNEIKRLDALLGECVMSAYGLDDSERAILWSLFPND